MEIKSCIVRFAAGRGRQIIFAYATSLLSKLMTAVCQISALPLAAQSLGDVRFGFLMFLGAATSFLTLPAQGFSSAISYGIAAASGEKSEERYEFWSITIMGFVLWLFIIMLSVTLSLSIDLKTAFGDAVSEADSAGGFSAVLAYVALFSIFSWADGFRAGYKENHITNLFSTGGAAATIIATCICVYFKVSLFYFFFALYAMPLLVQAINMALLLKARPYLLRGPRFSAEYLRAAARRAIMYSTAQLGAILKMHGTTMIIGRMVGFEASAVVGALFRIIVLCYSALLGMLLPILPTLTTATINNDRRWVERGVAFCLSVCIGGGMLIGVFISTLGQYVLQEAFSLSQNDGDHVYIAIGLMAYFFVSSGGCFLIMFALGISGAAGGRILVEGVLILGMTVISLNFFGVSEVIFIQAGISMLLTGYLFPARLIKFILANRRHTELK